MSNLTTFVKEKLPEFVRNDHPMFETFMGAYYEWMESTNTGTSTSVKDLHKELPNPLGIINDIESYSDVDETLNQFINFFAEEMVPVSIENLTTDKAFFLKKTRDMYLAKGTPKSFRLFFKLFFNSDVDIYETKDNILRTSNGNYLSFPIVHVYVEEFAEYLQDFNFSFSTISDSDAIVGTILQGSIVDRNPQTDQYILKIILSNDVDFKLGNTYSITDTYNNVYKILVSPLLSIENVRVKTPGSLYRNSDSIVFKTNAFRKTFTSSISEVSTGSVDQVVVRNRGWLYKPTDSFSFYSDDESSGLGGGFVVSTVDNDGTIIAINDTPVRSGELNKGWFSNSFESVYVKIDSGGYWNKLPNIQYTPNITLDRSVNFDDSVLQSQGRGVGAQITPISSSIGKIEKINFNQSPYFMDSDDISYTVPANLIVENLDNINEGDIINFRYWLSDPTKTLEDSEEVIYKLKVYSNYYYISDSDTADSEEVRTTKPQVPYDFDFDKFVWKTKSYSVQSSLGDSEMFIGYENDLSFSSLENTRRYNLNVDNSLDGGDYADVGVTVYNGGDYTDSDSESFIDGGPKFSFSRSTYHEVEVNFTDPSISALDDFYIDLLDNYVVSNEEAETSWSTNNNFLPNLSTLGDIGAWNSTGSFAKIQRIDGNVIQVVPYKNYPILTDSELNVYLEGKYNLVRIESVYEDDLTTKDEDYSPFQNIVHKINQGDIKFDFQIISRRDKQFWDESGFLSSSSASILRDGYYYSDYTYNVVSDVPYSEWKIPFRETMHPAGMILTATTIVNSEARGNPDTSVGFEHQTKTTNATFDSMLEYGQNPLPFILGENFQVDSDNIVHRVEEFNEANDELGLGWVISSDDYKYSPDVSVRQKNGDSFWDYEPRGWISEFSTQDSDIGGNVKQEIQYYAPVRDISSQSSRYGIKFGSIFRTEFNLRTDSDYSYYDSDLPSDLFSRFGDSDNSFKSIDYERLRTANDNRSYLDYPVNRKLEMTKAKANDLNSASKENKSLVYNDKDGVYYDYEAYEKKWNQDNTRRDAHEAGWYIQGWASYYQNQFINVANNSRNTLFNFDFKENNIIEKSAPYNKEAYQGGNTSWKNNYVDKGVINIIEDKTGSEEYRDPRISMKGRRG